MNPSISHIRIQNVLETQRIKTRINHVLFFETRDSNDTTPQAPLGSVIIDPDRLPLTYRCCMQHRLLDARSVVFLDNAEGHVGNTTPLARYLPACSNLIEHRELVEFAMYIGDIFGNRFRRGGTRRTAVKCECCIFEYLHLTR